MDGQICESAKVVKGPLLILVRKQLMRNLNVQKVGTIVSRRKDILQKNKEKDIGR